MSERSENSPCIVFAALVEEANPLPTVRIATSMEELERKVLENTVRYLEKFQDAEFIAAFGVMVSRLGIRGAIAMIEAQDEVFYVDWIGEYHAHVIETPKADELLGIAGI